MILSDHSEFVDHRMVITDNNNFHSNNTIVPRPFIPTRRFELLCIYHSCCSLLLGSAHVYYIINYRSCIDLDRRKHDTDGIMYSINDNKAAEGDFYTGDLNNIIIILWWIRVARGMQCAFHCMTFLLVACELHETLTFLLNINIHFPSYKVVW